MTEENKKKEEFMRQILVNNEYPQQIRKKRKQRSSTTEPLMTRNHKWVTFTWVRTITKVFRNTNLKVAFRTNNTIKHHVSMEEKTTDVYNLSGVYQMLCKGCPLKYVGQTGHTFRIRYNEHIREIRTNGKSSKFVQHILDTTHNYNTIERTMKILHVQKRA
jgi:hypothetical protein